MFGYTLPAAALVSGIAETQPFVEGNKQAALAAMLTFVAINGFELRASQEQLANWIIRLSGSLVDKGLAALIRNSLTAAGPA